ncbi:ABC transporter permease [Anaeromicropila populeti]|uniref:Putative aldouronate transport system permease protein n=1 Tax=Anaeromicropila populeti TaxID=37658 RepID=A0A1I6JH86_9FIRM|nr:ABC transporter permease subunit [Anaeromicropila populeti]SFR78336.1 putative aldouronate transport system permease protein [Anaeromicropila populeti]
MGKKEKSMEKQKRKEEVILMKSAKVPLLKHIRREWKLYAFLIIPIAYYIIFKYLPMAGNIIAFRKYRAGGPIFGIEWSGLKYFRQFIRDRAFWNAFTNTLIINFSYLLVRFPATLAFALLLNEIKNVRWKKFVQTVSYLPHFIAVVIVCGMVKELLSTSGPINAIIKAFGGEPISFIQLPEWFVTIFVGSSVWQALGWGTILYLAAMAGINTELYDAAKVDGANRFKQVWHVTIPGILPTITTILILDIGSIVGSGGVFERIIMLYNPMTYSTGDVISTYVYRMGVGTGNYSYATAVGLFEGIIGLILVNAANMTSRKVTKSSLW